MQAFCAPLLTFPPSSPFQLCYLLILVILLVLHLLEDVQEPIHLGLSLAGVLAVARHLPLQLLQALAQLGTGPGLQGCLVSLWEKGARNSTWFTWSSDNSKMSSVTIPKCYLDSYFKMARLIITRELLIITWEYERPMLFLSMGKYSAGK